MIHLEQFKPGTYRHQGDFKSFIPSLVNESWTWSSPRINHLLSIADKELGGLNTYSELVPDIDVYIRMHIQVEANRSSRIEGTNTTIEDDMTPLEDLSPERRDDVREVQNYIAAMNHGIRRIVADDFPFTSRLLREMHALLMEGVRGEHKTPGEFRLSQNFIGGSMPSNAAYVPPAVTDMQQLMGDLDKFMNREDQLPVLIKTAIIHYQFETIHPFLDGNGRIGRLMIPLYLMAQRELDKPCFYISSYFEEHRTAYYDTLQNVRVKGDMEGWIVFFLEASAHTARMAKAKFKAALAQVQAYQDYAVSKKARADTYGKIIQAMYRSPVSTVSEISDLTGLSFDTINRAARDLVKDKVLLEITGNRRNRIFFLQDYIRVFR